MKKIAQQKNPFRGGCLHCPGNHDILPLDTPVVAGFGMARITKNGETIYDEPPNTEFDDAPLLQKFEDMAKLSPEADWRYRLDLLLRSGEWQRHGEDQWVLIDSGLGFA